jgi:hypothetical protein
MPYTTEEGGRLNNFAKEPTVYQEQDPTGTEKRNYLVLGVIAAALISGLVFVAVSVSSVS